MKNLKEKTNLEDGKESELEKIEVERRKEKEVNFG